MTATEKFIRTLSRLEEGDLGLLRTQVGRGLDESVDGFDLFAGLWWPLRQKSHRAPRREVAWLVTKLFAQCPLLHDSEMAIASQLGRCHPEQSPAKERFAQRFDRALMLPLRKIEPALGWALRVLSSRGLTVDWVRLTDDLSAWERETKRLKWAKEFLTTYEGGKRCS